MGVHNRLSIAFLGCCVVAAGCGDDSATAAGETGSSGEADTMTVDPSTTAEPGSTGEPEDTTGGSTSETADETTADAADDTTGDTGADPACGNGVFDGELMEACDDGNQDDGDGCSSRCEVEPGYACEGEPSVCATECGDGVVAGAEQCDGRQRARRRRLQRHVRAGGRLPVRGGAEQLLDRVRRCDHCGRRAVRRRQPRQRRTDAVRSAESRTAFPAIGPSQPIALRSAATAWSSARRSATTWTSTTTTAARRRVRSSWGGRARWSPACA